MSSYSLDFPDVSILATLGDDITVSPVDGVPVPLKAVFEFKYIDDALADVGITYPTVEIDDSDRQYFENGYIVTFNNVKYKVLKLLPSQVEKTLVMLRTFFEV